MQQSQKSASTKIKKCAYLQNCRKNNPYNMKNLNFSKISTENGARIIMNLKIK
jgi:hypothetical protein